MIAGAKAGAVESEAAEHSGMVIIRAWLEPGSPPGARVRARITSTMDLTSGRVATSSAATIDGVLAVVRAHLETFAFRDGEGLGTANGPVS
ncbi:MAG: hypothetical protein NVSMB32_00150 [Actinomycetota bacterium]